jgi:membrane fusion protein, multidrug efflux system
VAEATLSKRAMGVGAAIIVAALLLLLLVGLLPRRSNRRVLEDRAKAAAVADTLPLVSVVKVNRAPANADLTLPGTLQPVHDASVYARSSGYVRGWYADIGARVTDGQLLAVIDAPDLDQQLSQAKSTEAQAQAQLVLAKNEAARWQQLVKDSVVTEDDYDQKQSAYQSQIASVQAAHDNVLRLQTLVGYERIKAPFAGVVTARNIDNGSYITAAGQAGAPIAAGATGTATELFHIARTDTMRVYVGVPQAYAPSVHANLLADLEVQELANRLFPGKIVRTADAVDLASRTLLTEVDVANKGGALLPGMYADVHFKFDRPSPPILMPGTALIFRTQGAQAAVVGSDSVAHFHSLRIGRDYGTVMEVVSGLDEGDLVVNQPSDALRDGQRVRARLATDRSRAGNSNDQRHGQQVQILEGFPNSPSPSSP